MAEALRLAERGRGKTAPNPMVGCVIVRGGKVVGRGFHRRAGGPHAEIEALKSMRGGARGATVYVTLEPCNHHGRTGPCVDALLDAKVARVVIAMRDPNPRVEGGGAARLRRAGVDVTVGVGELDARRLIAPWICWVTTGRPLVTLKAAVTLDGCIAARGGDARWVSGEESRRVAHEMRAASDAILVGAGTVRADDPQLNVRGVRGKDPLRVVVGQDVPAKARVWPALWFTTANRKISGAEVVRLKRKSLGEVLDALGARGIQSLLVEGGAAIFAQLIVGKLADRVAIFVAPKLAGDGIHLLGGMPGPSKMANAWQLKDVEIRQLGDDVLVTGSLR
jgi:diaminohydroxyphosphoribosylaminopyrimidine deaminase/5-amino-6-(5-phosphoribosylamino)uracil reductase